MFYKYDTRIITLLLNIFEHLKKDWDYTLVIVGDTGTGKSHFALQLLETWYKIILRQPITEEHAKQVASDYKVWLNNFKNIGAYDMNIYDEGATTLESRQHMTRLSKDLTKLFNVFRSKKFFSVIILPNFFYLNKYFRENRLRGVVWINKRGSYRFYSKLGVDFLNAYNERRIIKNMYVSHPIHRATFPKYTGVMLKAYEKQKNLSVEGVLDEVIKESIATKNERIEVVMHDEIMKLHNKGMNFREIAKKFGMSTATVHRSIKLASAT